MLIDTHAHLFCLPPDKLDETLRVARAKGVEKFIVPGTNLENSRQAVELARRYPGIIYAAVGVHPEELEGSQNLEYRIKNLIDKDREYIVAIGEVGTDAKVAEEGAGMEEQLEVLEAQLEIAVDTGLPVILHTRNSLAETLALIDQKPAVRGVFHSFSYDESAVGEIVRRGWMIGIGGNVSYAKRIQKVVKVLPKESFILETDTPFLPRDLPATPESVTILASLIATLRDESVDLVAETTTNNVKKLFEI